MSETVNDLELRVVAMSRSGIHAFVDWVLDATPGDHLFLNAAEGKADPFTTCRHLAEGQAWTTNAPRLDPAANNDARHASKDLLLVSYEDSFLAHGFSTWYEKHHDRLVGASARRVDVVLVRDPFNLFASRLRSGVGDVSPKAAMRVWKQHARAALGRMRPLPRRPLVVRYDRWCRDPAYRRHVAQVFDVPAADRAPDRVPDTLGGSSFDGTAYDGKAHRMRVFERWRSFIHDGSYRRLFDEEAVRLGVEVFGDGPGGEEVADAAEALKGCDRRARPAVANTTRRGSGTPT